MPKTSKPRDVQQLKHGAVRSFESIAEELHCTRQNIQNIERTALRKLKDALAKRGIKSTTDLTD